MRKPIAALALVFFCLPIGLRVVGVHAHPFENRRLAAAPRVADGWNAFDQATRFFVDRMPLREQAVRANTSISLHVFDTTPDYGRQTAGGNAARDPLPFGAPSDAKKPNAGAKRRTATGAAIEVQPGVTVLPGRAGWLFLEEELGRACQFFIPWDEAVRRIERALSIIRASGRRVVFAIPPDKSTVYPEYLPDSYKEKDCAARGRRTVWSAIEGSRDPDLLGLRKAMLAVKAPPPNETYYRKDTHWDTKGAILALREILKRLGGPVQLEERDIHKARAKVKGDLTNLMGQPEAVDSPTWSIWRDVGPITETTEHLGGKAVAQLLTRAPGRAPLIEGRTLFIHDSYGDLFSSALSAYAHRLAVLPWFQTPPAAFIEAIRRSDTVIFEKVERDVDFYASNAGLFTPRFLDRLQRQLERR